MFDSAAHPLTDGADLSARLTGELERFQSLFSNESELTKTLASLLRRLPNISGVQITHGPRELGKDIVFYSSGPLAEKRLNACVVKNIKISGSVDSKTGAMTILHQVQQALDNPYITGTGTPEQVSFVYVINPFELSQTATQSIQGSLAKHCGQVSFLCGGNLLDLFKEYWPEFLVFESGILGAYVASVYRQIEKDDPVSTLIEQQALIATVAVSFKEVYVRQTFMQEFTLLRFLFEKPSLKPIARPMSQKSLDEYKFQLRAWIHFINLPQFRSIANAAATDIFTITQRLGSDFVLQLSYAFNSVLEKRYSGFRKEQEISIPEYEETNLKIIEKASRKAKEKLYETELQLDIQDINRLEEQFKCDFEIIAKWILAFSAQLEVANRFVEMKHQWASPACLASSEYLLYCLIQDVARAAPNLLARKSPSQVAQYPETLLDEHLRSIFIMGPPGHGKTSFCKWNILRDVDELASKRSSVIPVYVILHHLATRRLGTYEEEFFQDRDLNAIITRDATKGGTGMRIRIYLDGLDEIPSVERQKEIVELAQRAVASDPRIQIVLTAREHVLAYWLSWIPKVRINKLSPPQVKQLLSNLLAKDEVQIKRFFAELRKVPTLGLLMSVPLLSTLIIAVFKRTKALPENRIRLYQTFIDILIGGWDMAKNVSRKTQFGTAPKWEFLIRLAGIMHMARKREADEDDCRKAASRLGPGFEQKAESLMDELLQDGLILKSGSIYSFAHLSFQEYLAARDLFDPTGIQQLNALKRFLQGEDWWREVLVFYIGITNKPTETKQWITAAFSELQNQAQVDRYALLMESVEHASPGWRIPVLDR